MAIIDGKAPPSEQRNLPARIVVKLSERHSTRSSEAPELRSRAISSLREAAGVELRPYFSEDQALRVAATSPFDLYLAAEIRDRTAADDVVKRLRQLPEVDEVYVEGGPCPPPVNPNDDPRSANQGYLNAAPGGIDARWAWGSTDGNGVGFVDLEQGWTLNHEDLAAAGITLISGVNAAYPGHGTAVLGEVVGADNTLGVVGIAPRASARVVSQFRTATTYSTPAAILSAVQAMSAGDVLLLEAQTPFNGLSNLPVEIEAATFDAIRFAVDSGIVVVEAAGNGSHDLDTVVDAANRQRLNRSSSDFRDSGAILVGAASSGVPHSRLSFSNFGSRIDCYAWGENINTTGDGWMGTSTTAYTTSFGGTSGASPMIAASCLLMQSWRKKVQQRHYDPAILRDLLTSASTNTQSANPATDRIGVMPNLRGIIEAEQAASRFRINIEKYLSVVYILFGIINDAPGYIWVPGKGPVPVDPGWKDAKLDFTGPKKDLLLGLAMHEMSELVEDPASRAKLAKASAESMQQAVRQIARG
ncbi:S8 family peptidase [Variovorax sp. RT4R15]|uniref:S8 family peptidase n=1 Tax=Variovorax sp. RT4R15 TaxID=3443737 RepID=UPI003F4660B8